MIGDEDVEAIIIVVVTRRLLVDPCPSFCRGKTAPGGGCGSRSPRTNKYFSLTYHSYSLISISSLILTSLPPKIFSCPHFSLSYTSCTSSIYTLYSNSTSHKHNFFFNIPPSYPPFSNLLSILLTIQLQSLFFFFILYLPIITNSILFFQLNSLYINFNYYPIHLYPIIYTNPLIIYFNFNTSH